MKNDGSTSCAQKVILLKHGVPQGNPNLNAKRCGAKAKQTGRPCRGMAIRGKNRCRLHGGKSTGAKTIEGKKRAVKGREMHKLYSRNHIKLLLIAKETCKASILFLKSIK